MRVSSRAANVRCAVATPATVRRARDVLEDSSGGVLEGERKTAGIVVPAFQQAVTRCRCEAHGGLVGALGEALGWV